MSFVVIAYPKISPKDYTLIQDIRKDNDPIMYEVVKPHVTFVFPTMKLNAEQLAVHVQDHLDGFSAFPVTFDKTKVVEDDSKTYTHAFLIPSIGYEEINKLHDLLYVDDMASELREDIPFVPHLGIGTDPNRVMMEKLTNKITDSNMSVSGTIDELVICEYDGKTVVDITRISLN